MGKRGWTGLLVKAFGGRDHVLTVMQVKEISAGFLRLRFHSETLFQEIDAVPTAWLRLWLPDTEGSDIEYQRAYTIFDADVEAGEFSVDFLVHEPAGPGSAWAQVAEVGDQIAGVSLGSSRFTVQQSARGYLLVGDAASGPALRSILEALPESATVRLFMEEHSPNDREIELGSHPGLVTTWVKRESSTSLLDAVSGEDWSGWYPWVTPESETLKHLRKYLKETYDFDKNNSHFQAYWIAGRAMGKSRN